MYSIIAFQVYFNSNVQFPFPMSIYFVGWLLESGEFGGLFHVSFVSGHFERMIPQGFWISWYWPSDWCIHTKVFQTFGIFHTFWTRSCTICTSWGDFSSATLIRIMTYIYIYIIYSIISRWDFLFQQICRICRTGFKWNSRGAHGRSPSIPVKGGWVLQDHDSTTRFSLELFFVPAKRLVVSKIGYQIVIVHVDQSL